MNDSQLKNRDKRLVDLTLSRAQRLVETGDVSKLLAAYTAVKELSVPIDESGKLNKAILEMIAEDHSPVQIPDAVQRIMRRRELKIMAAVYEVVLNEWLNTDQARSFESFNFVPHTDSADYLKIGGFKSQISLLRFVVASYLLKELNTPCPSMLKFCEEMELRFIELTGISGEATDSRTIEANLRKWYTPDGSGDVKSSLRRSIDVVLKRYATEWDCLPDEAASVLYEEFLTR